MQTSNGVNEGMLLKSMPFLDLDSDNVNLNIKIKLMAFSEINRPMKVKFYVKHPC